MAHRKQYSYIQHVAKSLLLSRFKWSSEVAVFTDYTAYFDAAGAAHRKGAIAISGFVSDVKKWAHFGIEWRRILDRESISCFHMTDFVSLQGEFLSWRGQPERSNRFLSDLIECTKKHVNKAFGGAVILEDYDRVNRKYRLQESGGYPYSLSGHYTIGLVQKWQKKKGVSDVIYMFEEGDLHQGDLTRLCSPEGITPLFPSKTDALPCQAADLFAWRTRNAFEEALKPNLTIERAKLLKSRFDQVWRKIPHAAFYGNRERLEKFCVERGIPKR